MNAATEVKPPSSYDLQSKRKSKSSTLKGGRLRDVMRIWLSGVWSTLRWVRYSWPQPTNRQINHLSSMASFWREE